MYLSMAHQTQIMGGTLLVWKEQLSTRAMRIMTADTREGLIRLRWINLSLDRMNITCPVFRKNMSSRTFSFMTGSAQFVYRLFHHHKIIR